MASAFTLSQSDLQDPDRDHSQVVRASAETNHLSPPTLSRVDSESLTPSIIQFDTPAGSHESPSHYQPSDFSDLDEDPFLGANFNVIEGGTPSFLDGEVDWDRAVLLSENQAPTTTLTNNTDSSYPLTPEQTASAQTTSPAHERKSSAHAPSGIVASVSPHELHTPYKPPAPLAQEPSQLTPSGTNSGRSSEDGLVPAPIAMPCQSPRVTVSVWDHENGTAVHTTEREFGDGANTPRGVSAGDLISSALNEGTSSQRDSFGIMERDPKTGHGGYDPHSRPTDEVSSSINELANLRQTDERNHDVGRWLSSGINDGSVPMEKTPDQIREYDRPQDIDDGIPMGHNTYNRYVEGQTYLEGNGGALTDVDRDIFHADKNFGDRPTMHEITGKRYQPESSQAAIERFERMYRDTDSILSRAATWGTRRRSMPSVHEFDIEGVTSGSFLKKLSISRGNGEKSTSKPAALFKGLFRRPSISSMRNKRPRSGQGESSSQAEDEQKPEERRDSSPHLSPTSRTSSWGKKETPSINTMLAASSLSLASIGSTTHARSSSISGGSPLPSPRPSRPSLTVINNIRRPRSKSELPKATKGLDPTDAQSGLADMWRKTGGPPVVAALSKSIKADVDDEDDDDDDDMDDDDMTNNPNLIDNVSANFAGFREHILLLNPDLAMKANYLADRIAHQQTIRFKQLLTGKVKHLKLGANCSCGSYCLALGGTAVVLDQKGDARDIDPLSTSLDGLEDGTIAEGVINQDSFPQDIPMPPTQYLPAEFECQLCYQRKKFQKPSDWTKHVHEDVQPFTCTWDKCKDPKIFKRKADWVRHENEGHRHLEWWTCDVEDCRHTCYRRDNFLQHLVREHKFPEPKLKTKAAMKRAGAADTTWQRVEQCHIETPKRPQEEPCKFCGRVFPTWKKLTVHLAKHMEQISLPVLRLVAVEAKKVAADTIISPVHDPPPTTRLPISMDQSLQNPTGQYHDQYNGQSQFNPHAQQMGYHGQQSAFVFPVSQANQLPQQFYPSQFDTMNQQSHHAQMGNNSGQLGTNQGYEMNRGMGNLSASSNTYLQPNNVYMQMNNSSVEPFPDLDDMSMHQVQTEAMGGQQMHLGYDNNMIPNSSVNGSPFSGHESLSNYSHSPHMNGGNQEGNTSGWGDGNMHGF